MTTMMTTVIFTTESRLVRIPHFIAQPSLRNRTAKGKHEDTSKTLTDAAGRHKNTQIITATTLADCL